MRINWDVLGISASVACAIHCAILPIFISALPLFGWEILHNPWFEGGMIGLAFVIGTLTLYHGYKHHHRQWMPVMLFASGFVFLVAKEGFSENSSLHHLLLIPAVGLIIPAHFLNLRYTARARKAGADCPTKEIKAV